MSSPQPKPAMAPAPKSIFASKTFWVAVLVAGTGAVNSLGSGHYINSNTALVLAGVLMALLRLLTNQGVTVP